MTEHSDQQDWGAKQRLNEAHEQREAHAILYSRRHLLAPLLGAGMLSLTGATFAQEAVPAPDPAGQSIRVHSGQKVAFLGASINEYGWSHPNGYIKLVVNCLDKGKN